MFTGRKRPLALIGVLVLASVALAGCAESGEDESLEPTASENGTDAGQGVVTNDSEDADATEGQGVVTDEAESNGTVVTDGSEGNTSNA